MYKLNKKMLINVGPFWHLTIKSLVTALKRFQYTVLNSILNRIQKLLVELAYFKVIILTLSDYSF